MENHAKTLHGLHILVVEDDAIVAMMLEDMLLDFGCRVDLAPSIKSALAAIRDHPLDGVLLDMNIHGQQTTAVAEELRWPPKIGQAAKRESSLGTAGWPEVRVVEYTEEAQS